MCLSTGVLGVEFRLEMITVPVSDVDRAKSFYVEQLGFDVQQAFLEARRRKSVVRLRRSRRCRRPRFVE